MVSAGANRHDSGAAEAHPGSWQPPQRRSDRCPSRSARIWTRRITGKGLGPGPLGHRQCWQCRTRSIQANVTGRPPEAGPVTERAPVMSSYSRWVIGVAPRAVSVTRYARVPIASAEQRRGCDLVQSKITSYRSAGGHPHRVAPALYLVVPALECARREEDRLSVAPRLRSVLTPSAQPAIRLPVAQCSTPRSAYREPKRTRGGGGRIDLSHDLPARRGRSGGRGGIAAPHGWGTT